MSKNSEIFYIAKYTKGYDGKLVLEKNIENIELSVLQKIFGVDPNHPDILTRNLVYCYNISDEEAIKLTPYIDLEFDLNKYDYQTGLRKDENGRENYIVKAFEKSTPWRFIEECQIHVSLDFLRLLFKDEKYDSDPTEIGFSPLINLERRYSVSLQPYVNFKLELDKYDYWVEKRHEGEARDPDVEFV